MKKWKLGVFLLLLLLAISPLSGQDSSTVVIDKADWMELQTLFNQQETLLTELKTQLKESQTSITQLETYLTNTKLEIQTLQKKVNTWKWVGGVSIGIAIGGLAYILITSLQ